MIIINKKNIFENTTSIILRHIMNIMFLKTLKRNTSRTTFIEFEKLCANLSQQIITLT